MAEEDSLVQAFRFQAAGCAALGSAFSGALLERAIADWTAGGPTRALLAPWAEASAPSLIADAVPLRLLGALHDIVLSGESPDLTAAYPAEDRAGEPDRAWTAALRAVAIHGQALSAFMSHEPQTNEVRRSACLLPGFLAVAAETGLDLRCLELGASAGLNQLWDRYHYRLGETGAWGAPDAPVLIDTDWRGPPPRLEARVRVVERAACDRKPVDLTDPIARRRLRAYVWPDQRERLARLDAAIDATLAAGIKVEAEDAVAWTRRHAAPRAGVATVLFHSVFWQYMPSPSQASGLKAIETHAAGATASAPFAWLRMEPTAGRPHPMELRLTLWPGGEDRLLAHVHPHGAWVEWKV